MDKLKELRKKLEDAIARMEEILNSGEEKDFTEDEEKEYSSLEKDVEKLKADIKIEEEKLAKAAERKAALEKEKEELKKPVNIPDDGNIVRNVQRVQVNEPEDFKSLDEFLDIAFRAVLRVPGGRDNRLMRYYSPVMHIEDESQKREFRDMSMGEATAGGYMVPAQWVPELKELAIQNAIVRPRADVIPAGSPPDAEVTIPVGNQETYINMGVDVVWVGEGKTKTETEPVLKEHSWIPHEVAGYITLTDKLLRNWPAAMAFAKKRLSFAIMQAEDWAFLRGTGVAQPHGILTQNCRILQARNTALQINWADVRDMYWQCYKLGGSPIWVYNPSCLPQLMGISDPNTSGTMIWQPSAREGEPSRLLGIPMVENQRSPVLGAQGDLMLLNLSYYVIKDGSGPFIAASPHVYFTSNKTVVKIFWNVDGDSWLQAPIPLEDGTNQMSPFIILDA